jgi:hypothetical protein
LDSIRARRDDSHVVGSPSNKLSSLVDNTDNLDDKDLLNAVKETFKENVDLKLDIHDANKTSSSQDLPEINIDSNNSTNNSSIEHYFPKPEVYQEDVKSRFNNLFSQITNRRDDSNVVGSPQISQLGLSPKLSPLNTKPSISNLLDDTAALFEDEDDVIPISNIDKGKSKEISINESENLFSTLINS